MNEGEFIKVDVFLSKQFEKRTLPEMIRPNRRGSRKVCIQNLEIKFSTNLLDRSSVAPAKIGPEIKGSITRVARDVLLAEIKQEGYQDMLPTKLVQESQNTTPIIRPRVMQATLGLYECRVPRREARLTLYQYFKNSKCVEIVLLVI